MTITEKGIKFFKAAKDLIDAVQKQGDDLELGEAIRILQTEELYDLILIGTSIKNSLSGIHDMIKDDCSLNSIKNQLYNIDYTLSETLTAYRVGAALDAIVTISEVMQEKEAEDD